MITISNGISEFSPLLLTAYEAASDSNNIAHDIIGRADPDFSLGGESTREGTLPMMFASAEDMAVAEAILAAPAVFTLSDTERPEVDMTFIRFGTMRRRRGRTRGSWMLEVGFREVAG